MKRIFTSFAVLCLLATAQKGSTQQTLAASCSTGGTVAQGSQNQFTSNAESFTGDFSYDNQGQNNYLRSTTVGSGIKKSLISSVFTLAANQSSLSFGFILGGTADVTNYALSLVDASNANVYSACSGAAITNGTKTFTVPFPAALTGKKFKIQVDFTLSGKSQHYITVDNFITSATASQIPLPVNFTGIEARKVSNGTQITWNVAQEEGVVNYSVEKSTDGRNFSKVVVVPATVSSSYTFVDTQPSTNTAYYRVISNDKDGKQKFSTTIKVDGSKASFVRNVYPMPATTEVFIQHNAAPAGTTVSLLSQDGRLIQRLQVQNGSLQTRVDLSSLRPGMYMVRFDNDSNNTEPLKIIKQ